MADQTTTTDDVQQTGAQEALPVESAPEVAVQETTETTPTEEQKVDETVEQPAGEKQESEGGDTPVPEDDKLAKFAKGQGIDNLAELSEREKKLLKVAYDNNAEYQRNRQRASELEKSASDAADQEIATYEEQSGETLSETDKMVRKLVVRDNVRTFFENKPEAKPFEKAMIEELQKKPYLKDDLDTLYAVAVVNSGGVDSVKSQAKQETLQSLAQKQQAAVPTGAATTSGTPKAKPFAEKSIEEMEADLGFAKP